jgi:hypothetical protein
VLRSAAGCGVDAALGRIRVQPEGGDPGVLSAEGEGRYQRHPRAAPNKGDSGVPALDVVHDPGCHPSRGAGSQGDIEARVADRPGDPRFASEVADAQAVVSGVGAGVRHDGEQWITAQCGPEVPGVVSPRSKGVIHGHGDVERAGVETAEASRRLDLLDVQRYPRALAGKQFHDLALQQGRWPTSDNQVVISANGPSVPGPAITVGKQVMTVVGVADSVTNTADARVLPAEMNAIARSAGTGQAQLISQSCRAQVSVRGLRSRW